jgi:enamine deaminase RidA (YjgF/YER057c/UK114 family)
MHDGRNDRRWFLQRSAAAMSALGAVGFGAAGAAARQISPEQRVRELGLQLPEPQGDFATLASAVQSGSMLYVSGHGPRGADGRSVTGRLGADLSIEEGHAAARLAGLNVLATVRGSLGSLDRVARVVKILGMVTCTPEFTQQSRVINGFSELMIEVFGETLGKGARSAVGMAALPAGWAVEVEAIFEVRPG